jgi:hypothetical protein
MDIERRADGTTLLRSPQKLRGHARAVGEWLLQWARAAPERVFLAERQGEGWRSVGYREALELVRRVGQGLLDRGLDARRPVASRPTTRSPHAAALGAMRRRAGRAGVARVFADVEGPPPLHAIFELLAGLLWTSTPGNPRRRWPPVGARPVPFAELLATEASGGRRRVRAHRPGQRRRVPFTRLDWRPEGRRQTAPHVTKPEQYARLAVLRDRRRSSRLAAVEPHLRRQQQFQHDAVERRHTSMPASPRPARSRPACAT